VAEGSGISGLAVFYATAGGILLWSGFKGQTVAQTVKAIVSGNSAALTQQGSQAVGSPQLTADYGPASGSGGSSGSSDTTAASAAAAAASAAASAPASDKAGTPETNQALGLLMAGAYGWATAGEWPYLQSGWQEESGWNQYAANDPSDPYNHAYGIPQANPGTKMASAGSDWQWDPVTQIKWGLAYIKATYGSPSQVPGWTPNGVNADYAGY
jgi:hypothetical protein